MSSEKFDLEKEALDWEYSNFSWRDHQELPFKKLEALREKTIPDAYKAGYLKAQEQLGQRDREIAESAWNAALDAYEINFDEDAPTFEDY